MKKYNIFNLFVVKIDKKKFICEYSVTEKRYIEIITGKKIDFNDNYNVEELSNYYNALDIMNYVTREPLMLSKYDILSKYLEINMYNIGDEYYQGQIDLSYIVNNFIENPNEFYRIVGKQLSPEERQYIKSFIPKSCDTCLNGCCRVEQVDKPIQDCFGWENDRIIGEYKILKLKK